MKNILVADVMTRHPVTARPDDDLLACARKMVRKKVGSLVLVDKGNLKGFISERDILWVLIKKSRSELSKIKASDISPKKIITIKPSATVDEAVKKMKKSKFERLPVTSNNEVLGIITIRDILSFHPEFYSELEEFAKIREETEKIKRLEKQNKNTPVVQDGICEECGGRGSLYRLNGSLVCSSCMNFE